MKEIESCTFHPKINKKSTRKVKSPIHKRYQEINDFKEKLIQDLRKKLNVEKNLPFRPEISEKSRKICEKINRGLPVEQRIQLRAELMKEKQKILEVEQYARENNECTFKPEINSDQNIKILKESNNRGEYEENFLIRQEMFDLSKKGKQMELSKQIQQEKYP